MIRNKIIIIITFALALGALSLGFYKEKGDSPYNRLSKTNNNDFSEYIAINQILMWISNNGMGSHDPRVDQSGFFWPGGIGATQTAIFSDGLIWGARVGREIRTGGATYRYGLQAGKILDNGEADDPGLSKYRVYKIRKNWESVVDADLRDQLETDYNEWPGEDGAPYIDVDEDGMWTPGVDLPEFIGDEVLWCVSNDLDASRTTYLYGTNPMGLEVHTTVFGFNLTGDLGDMVFKKYMIVNKGTRILRDVILGYWSDTDLGVADDDYTGCDTVLSLGYTYNGDSSDDIYNNMAPPAVGYDFFQGPIVESTNPTDSAKFLGEWRHGYRNLPMTAFTFYINGSDIYADPDLGVAVGSQQMYNYLDGYVWNGDPFIDPHTSLPSKFVLPGDPVEGNGWYEGAGWPGGFQPGDRRHLMASGPFTMSPGDTQEIVVGILAASGTDNIQSVEKLKEVDQSAQIAYDLDFDITSPPDSPVLHHYSGDEQITLWWENNAESYDEPNPLIFGRGLSDTTYSFEGYKVYQFPSAVSSIDDGELLATYDLQNGVDRITEWRNVGDVNPTQVEFLVFTSPDSGITNKLVIDRDEIDNDYLVNGNPYYFAVTAYGVNLNSTPAYLESSPVIVTIYPRKNNVDETIGYEVGEGNLAELTEGDAHAHVTYTVIDPATLQDADYEVTISGSGRNAEWSLFDITDYLQDTTIAKDTLVYQSTNFGDETEKKKFNSVFNGLYVNVYNDALDSLGNASSKIKEVVEVVNGETTGNVFEETGSAANYSIISNGYLPYNNQAPRGMNTLNTYNAMKHETIEIRFTEGGSQYYAAKMKSASFNGAGIAGDPLASDRVPFEVWSLGHDTNDPSDDYRLVVKVIDSTDLAPERYQPQPVSDNKWTHLSNGQWEGVYAFNPSGGYPDTFDPTSPKYNNNTNMLTNFVIDGDIPPAGTVVRITTFRSLEAGDVFHFSVTESDLNDKVAAKDRFDNITVFPNPYYGTHNLEANKYNRFVRFLGLPQDAIIRIFSLSGVFVDKIEKHTTSDFVDWDMQNKDGLPVASGMYIAHIDMPGIGEKILKLAIIVEAQYIDRI